MFDMLGSALGLEVLLCKQQLRRRNEIALEGEPSREVRRPSVELGTAADQSVSVTRLVVRGQR